MPKTPQKHHVRPQVVIHRAVSRITASVDIHGVGGKQTEDEEVMMEKSNSFRFLDDDLNQQLLALLKKGKIKHDLGTDGIIHYSPADEEVVENDLICSIRDKVFPSWQVLTCPRDWIARYKKYMSHRGIPFHEELSNGELWFLLPRKYRPHRWKLDDPMTAERMAM
jgi:hypothetical protein